MNRLSNTENGRLLEQGSATSACPVQCGQCLTMRGKRHQWPCCAPACCWAPRCLQRQTPSSGEQSDYCRGHLSRPSAGGHPCVIDEASCTRRVPINPDPGVFAAQRTLLEAWRIVTDSYEDSTFNGRDWVHTSVTSCTLQWQPALLQASDSGYSIESEPSAFLFTGAGSC